ncbi:MAG: hypothetical protein E7429_05885 [Ruminococcaceae bacterium]|nr:hypothetical protein [Oscillospiraceae bacterium]
MRKRIGLLLLVLVCAACMQVSVSADGIQEVFVDARGGTVHTTRGMDMFDITTPVEEGSTLSSQWVFEDPTCLDKDFVGWYAYATDTGAQLPGTGLMTTAEILNYPIAGQRVSFVAQWTQREGYPVTAITYAALYNGLGEPDYNVRVTLVNNGVRYSGNGYVTISKEVYSQWTGDVQVIWELPGEFVDGNGRWNPDYFDAVGPVHSFIKEGSCYISVSKTGKEQERPADRRKVNEFFYSVRNAEPEISYTVDADAGSVSDAAGVLPEGTSMQAQQYRFGAIYDLAVTSARSKLGTENIQVFDITLKDAAGKALHQLDGFVEVKLAVPEGYTVQAGNTVAVYYLADDGGMEACETAYDPAAHTLTFKTNHFSVYVFAEVPQEAEPEPVPGDAPEQEAPEEGEPEGLPVTPAPPAAEDAGNGGAGLYVILAAAAVAVVAAGVLLKKRR